MITNLSYEQIRTKYQFDKHIWEGWRVIDFINELEDRLDEIMEYKLGAYADPLFKTKEQIKQWVKDNLPYTLKALREVTKYFVDKYDRMPVASWSTPDGSNVLKLK